MTLGLPKKPLVHRKALADVVKDIKQHNFRILAQQQRPLSSEGASGGTETIPMGPAHPSTWVRDKLIQDHDHITQSGKQSLPRVDQKSLSFVQLTVVCLQGCFYTNPILLHLS